MGPNGRRNGVGAGLLVALVGPAWGQTIDAVTIEVGLLSLHSGTGGYTERTFAGFGGVLVESALGLAVNVGGVHLGEGLVAQLKGGWRIGRPDWPVRPVIRGGILYSPRGGGGLGLGGAGVYIGRRRRAGGVVGIDFGSSHGTRFAIVQGGLAYRF